MNENMRGALLMSGAMAAFTANDGLMKAIMVDVPFFQAIFLRSLGGFLVLFLASRWYGRINLRISRRDRIVLVVRSMAEVFSALFFLLALRAMPLPNVNAILQALPLALTLAGALIFGERIGWRRMTAILVGMVGVLLIVRPGAEGFGWPSLLALASVATVVVRDLVTRTLSPSVTSMTAALVMAAFLAAFSGVGAAFVEWQPVSRIDMLRLCCSIICVASGYIFLVNAMRVGEIAVVAPFRYTGLIWALVIGYFGFGFWPDALSLVGAGIIVAAGIFTFYREMLVKRGDVTGSVVADPAVR